MSMVNIGWIATISILLFSASAVDPPKNWLEDANQEARREAPSLLGPSKKYDDLVEQKIHVGVGRVVHDWCFSVDGKRLYYAMESGLVRCLSVPEFTVVAERDLEVRLSFLQLTASGVLVGSGSPATMYVLNPESLETKRKVVIKSSVYEVAGAPTSSYAFVTNKKRTKIQAFDTRTGKLHRPLEVSRLTKTAMPQGKRTRPELPDKLEQIELTPDGRYLFSRSRSHPANYMHRFRVNRDRLRYETSTQGSQPSFSPDGKFVTFQLPKSRGGRYAYCSVGDLEKPLRRFESACLAFPEIDRVFSIDRKGLVIKNQAGHQLRRYRNVRQMAWKMHPSLRHALCMNGQGMDWYTFPDLNAAPPQPEEANRESIFNWETHGDVRMRRVGSPHAPLVKDAWK